MCKYLFMAALLLLGANCKKNRDLNKVDYIKPLLSLSDDAVMLIFSSSIEGYVKSCGCTSAPLGDLARFAQVFDDLKRLKGSNIIFIDSGNLLFDSMKRNEADLCQDDARLSLLLSTFKELGLSLTIVGPFDDARGALYRQNLYNQMGIKAWSKPLNEEIFEINNQRIGVLGIKDGASKEETTEAIKRIQGKKLDALIALSQMPQDAALKFFKDFSAIDVVIQGQTSSFAPLRPLKLTPSGPLFIEGGRQEHYFTLLVLEHLALRKGQALLLDERAYDNNAKKELLSSRLRALKAQEAKDDRAREQFLKKRIELAQHELDSLNKSEAIKPLDAASALFLSIALGKSVPALAAVQAKLDAYEKSIPKLVDQCEKSLVCPTVKPGQASYVGAQTCKKCHTEAYDLWQKALYLNEGQNEEGQMIKRHMGHSKAWQTLVEAHKDHDRTCIGCHSIGFMKEGGYCKASQVDFRKDVQCESCHGPGSLHAQSGQKDQIHMPTEKTCRECHHVPHIKSYDSFDYQQSLKKILGPGHGARLLQEISHKAKS